MAKLPTVTSNVAPDLRAFLDRVREAINGTGADSLVSVRQLVAAGVVTHTGTGITGTGGTGLVSPPIRPANVGAAGALANIMVTWDKPIYNGHAYAEIWSAARSTEQAAATPPENPILGQAELVGMAPGVFFAHNLGAGATRFYWVRFVNLLGEVGPYQSTEGILGQTSVDPAYMLEVLTGAITEGQLYNDLSSRIDLIDGASTLAGSVAQRILDEHNSRVSAQAVISSAVTAEESARQDADSATTQQLNVAVSQYQHNAASIFSEQTTRASADEAVAQQVSTVASSLGDAFAGIQSEATVRTVEDSALAQQINAVVAQSGTTAAAVQSEATVRTVEDSALAQQINAVVAQSGTTAAAVQTETTVRANADSSNASLITSLTSTTGDNAAAVQTEASARAAADDVIEAKYTVKVDVGGHVAGYGLIANANNGATVSEFGIRADQFFLAPPTIAQNSAPASAARYVGMSWVDTDNNDLHRYWSGTAWVVDSPSLPFIVRTSPTTINGEAVPAGVYIRDGFIQNGTIVNAQIGDAAIDNAKIDNINADKINAGFIDAARIEAGSIDANMIDSRGLSIKDAAGNIILAAGSPLGLSNVSGLGTLATANDITMSSVTDAGTLATANDITMSSVTDAGTLATANNITMSSVTDAGTLATADDITMSSVTDAGGFATLDTITAANVSTYIASAAIDNAQIGNTIQSNNFSSGSAGWRIQKNGNAELNDATFRGTLDVGGSSGSRMTITSTKLRVYDGNTLRVKIGDLS